MIVTLNEVKDYLRIDHDGDDALLLALIATATALALTHTANPALTDLTPTPELLKMAILSGVLHLYDKAGRAEEYDPVVPMAPFLAPFRKWVF